jgi:hypothetical protein
MRDDSTTHRRYSGRLNGRQSNAGHRACLIPARRVARGQESGAKQQRVPLHRGPGRGKSLTATAMTARPLASIRTSAGVRATPFLASIQRRSLSLANPTRTVLTVDAESKGTSRDIRRCVTLAGRGQPASLPCALAHRSGTSQSPSWVSTYQRSTPARAGALVSPTRVRIPGRVRESTSTDPGIVATTRSRRRAMVKSRARDESVIRESGQRTVCPTRHPACRRSRVD